MDLSKFQLNRDGGSPERQVAEFFTAAGFEPPQIDTEVSLPDGPLAAILCAIVVRGMLRERAGWDTPRFLVGGESCRLERLEPLPFVDRGRGAHILTPLTEAAISEVFTRFDLGMKWEEANVVVTSTPEAAREYLARLESVPRRGVAVYLLSTLSAKDAVEYVFGIAGFLPDIPKLLDDRFGLVDPNYAIPGTPSLDGLGRSLARKWLAGGPTVSVPRELLAKVIDSLSNVGTATAHLGVDLDTTQLEALAAELRKAL